MNYIRLKALRQKGQGRISKAAVDRTISSHRFHRLTQMPNSEAQTPNPKPRTANWLLLHSPFTPPKGLGREDSKARRQTTDYRFNTPSVTSVRFFGGVSQSD